MTLSLSLSLSFSVWLVCLSVSVCLPASPSVCLALCLYGLSVCLCLSVWPSPRNPNDAARARGPEGSANRATGAPRAWSDEGKQQLHPDFPSPRIHVFRGLENRCSSLLRNMGKAAPPRGGFIHFQTRDQPSANGPPQTLGTDCREAGQDQSKPNAHHRDVLVCNRPDREPDPVNSHSPMLGSGFTLRPTDSNACVKPGAGPPVGE